jgi:histidinol-phosphatase
VPTADLPPPADSAYLADPADLTLALRLADEADALTVAAFRSAGLVVDTKPDLTPVTDADRGVETALRTTIAAERPGDAVVGEEYGTTGTGSRRWILDPIDGTKNFVRGIPVWATLIALEVDGVLSVGAVSAPALGRRWWAGRGLGAFAGPCPSSSLGGVAGQVAPIRVSAVSSLADAQITGPGLESWDEHPGGPARLAALAAATWRDRGFGDFWSHMLVAEGACDIGLDPVASLWDLAALQVIVEEAGGRFTDMGGEARADGGSAISTNGLVHDAALAILGAHDD